MWLASAKDITYTISTARKEFNSGDVVRTAKAQGWFGTTLPSRSEVHLVPDIDCFVAPGGIYLLADGDDLLQLKTRGPAMHVNIIILILDIVAHNAWITIVKGRYLLDDAVSYTIPSNETIFTEMEVLEAANKNAWLGNIPNYLHCNVYWWDFDVRPATKHLCQHDNLLDRKGLKIYLSIEEPIVVSAAGGARYATSEVSRKFMTHVLYPYATSASIIGAEQLEDLVEDDADALSAKLGTPTLAYSHKPDDEVYAVRWDATEHHDFYHINRPSSYDERRAEINKQTPLAPTDKLYFFPYSQIDSKASKKRKFNEITFDEWLALEKFPYMLPAVWIYSGDESPITSPRRFNQVP
jgi:hypothetical protein